MLLTGSSMYFFVITVTLVFNFSLYHKTGFEA